MDNTDIKHIDRIALTRHTCKAYDPTRKVAPEKIEQLKTLLRFAPSSVNSQPWHFFIAHTDAAKARVAKGTPDGTPFAANGGKVKNASHVVVLCARTRLEDAHLAALLAQEDKDGRFPTPEGKEMQNKGRSFYVGLHQNQLQDVPEWASKQVYLALGTLLLGAATLDIDATPIEGFDAALLDAELGLAEQGLKSVVLVALGYRSEDDFNAKLPKSRLPAAAVITEL
ncbi:oxygen-insensitive NAD(P)H nitroreductase [Zoogloea sp.]|uniref:oxygen-insensitive NAD(P)H nitroreductase n=1 Tax=Zoogloea sp. TaxID=49181 RepID=UPI0035B40D24